MGELMEYEKANGENRKNLCIENGKIRKTNVTERLANNEEKQRSHTSMLAIESYVRVVLQKVKLVN
jgi:hypothetical protein